MANIITAGNSTNGGTAISTDTSGTLNIVTGSGSGANAITIDASQNVAMTASQTIAGNLTVTGTLTATGGVSGGIRSGTAVASTSGTSIDFTGIPSTVKRITVMFNGVSFNSTASILVQLGTGSTTYTTSGYISTALAAVGGGNSLISSTSGFISYLSSTAGIFSGHMVITNINGNNWVATHLAKYNTAAVSSGAGDVSLGAVLTAVRITSSTGTDVFDAGTINILYE